MFRMQQLLVNSRAELLPEFSISNIPRSQQKPTTTRHQGSSEWKSRNFCKEETNMLPKIKFSDLREMCEFVDPMAKIWVWAGMGLSVKINNIQKFAYLIGKMMNQGFWMLYIALLFCFSFPIIFGQTYIGSRHLWCCWLPGSPCQLTFGGSPPGSSATWPSSSRSRQEVTCSWWPGRNLCPYHFSFVSAFSHVFTLSC